MTPIKKIAVFGALLAALGGGRLTATVLVTEAFDYADGNLHGKTGGTGFSGTWSSGGTTAITVSSEAAILTGAGASYSYRNIQATSASDLYFSYTISSTEMGTISSGSVYDVLIFKSSSTTIFSSGIYYDSNGLRLRATANGINTNLTDRTATSVDTAYTVVGKLTFDDGSGNAVLSIWINPTSEASAIVHTQSWASSLTSVTQIVLQRYDSSGVGLGTSTAFDDIQIGTDWASVTVIPEPSVSAGILGGVAGLAVVLLRRRPKIREPRSGVGAGWV